MLHPDAYKRKRFILILIMVILIPVGIWVKNYSGSGELLVSNKIAGMIYVVFWSFGASIAWIKSAPAKIVAIVFFVTCLLECTQLYSSPLLENVRSSYIGHALIGSSFNPYDMVYYAIGAILSFFWLKKINRAYLI